MIESRSLPPIVSIVLLSMLLIGCSSVPTAVVDLSGRDVSSLAQGLTYYASFSDGSSPDLHGGSEYVEDKGGTIVNGRCGDGLHFGAASLRMYAAGNYTPVRGTVAFWTRPEWDPEDEDVKGARVMFRGGWVQFCYSIDKGVCFFMTGKSEPPEGFRWTYTSLSDRIASWKRGEWHHVAITWDSGSGRKVIYLDGQSVSDETTDTISDRESTELPVTLGSAKAPGVYDEWAIWDRPLSASDVALLYNMPEAVSAYARILAAGRVPEQASFCPLTFEIQLTDPPVNSILVPGAGFAAAVPVTNTSSGVFDADLKLVLLDFRGRERAHDVRWFRLDPGAQAKIDIAFTAPPERGVFKIAVMDESEGRSWVRDVASFATWPIPTTPPDADTFFGNHVNSWYGGKFVEQAARLGLSWQRNHDMLQATWWNRVQPEPGAFAWTMDENLSYFSDRGMPVLGGLTGTPYWALEGGPKPKTRSARGYTGPPDLDYWRTYVRETVTHFKDRIHHWEIYNEPSVSMFWNGTPERFADTVNTACEAIRGVDPEATIMSGGFTSVAWDWQEQAARAGALRHLDVVSIHYGTPAIPPEENAEKLAAVLGHFRGLAETYGRGKDTPIWSTEGSTGDTTWFRGLDFPGLPPERLRSPINADLGAIRVVQGSALLQLQGVQKHFIYLHNPPNHGARAYRNTSMIDVNWAPRPKLIARVAMQEQLCDAHCVGEVRRPEEGKFWAVLYEAGTETVVLWWLGEGIRATVDVEWPGKVEMLVDIMGNRKPCPDPVPLSGEPCYVRVQALPEAVRRALAEARIALH